MRPLEILKSTLVESGTPASTVERLALTDRDLTRPGPKMSIEEAGAAAITAQRMSYDATHAFAALLSGATGSQHAQAVTRAYRLAGAAPDPAALARDLIAIHATGGAEGAAVRERIARRLAGVVRSRARRDGKADGTPSRP